MRPSGCWLNSESEKGFDFALKPNSPSVWCVMYTMMRTSGFSSNWIKPWFRTLTNVSDTCLRSSKHKHTHTHIRIHIHTHTHIKWAERKRPRQVSSHSTLQAQASKVFPSVSHGQGWPFLNIKRTILKRHPDRAKLNHCHVLEGLSGNVSVPSPEPPVRSSCAQTACACQAEWTAPLQSGGQGTATPGADPLGSRTPESTRYQRIKITEG